MTAGLPQLVDVDDDSPPNVDETAGRDTRAVLGPVGDFRGSGDSQDSESQRTSCRDLASAIPGGSYSVVVNRFFSCAVSTP